MTSVQILAAENLTFEDVVRALDTSADDLWDLLNKEQLISFLVTKIDQEVPAERRCKIVLNVKNVIVDELEGERLAFPKIGHINHQLNHDTAPIAPAAGLESPTF